MDLQWMWNNTIFYSSETYINFIHWPLSSQPECNFTKIMLWVQELIQHQFPPLQVFYPSSHDRYLTGPCKIQSEASCIGHSKTSNVCYLQYSSADVLSADTKDLILPKLQRASGSTQKQWLTVYSCCII